MSRPSRSTVTAAGSKGAPSPPRVVLQAAAYGVFAVGKPAAARVAVVKQGVCFAQRASVWYVRVLSLKPYYGR